MQGRCRGGAGTVQGRYRGLHLSKHNIRCREVQAVQAHLRLAYRRPARQLSKSYNTLELRLSVCLCLYHMSHSLPPARPNATPPRCLHFYLVCWLLLWCEQPAMFVAPAQRPFLMPQLPTLLHLLLALPPATAA